MSLFGYTRNKFRYDWCMSDGYPQSIDGSVTPSNFVAFGTFISGGGSTMGCKLAGFNHLGGVEIDPKTCECYRENHNPELLYNMDIRDFKFLNHKPNFYMGMCVAPLMMANIAYQVRVQWLERL